MKILITLVFTSFTLFAQIFDFNTISSDFNQTITNDENSTILYEGSFYASTDMRAFWEYKKPVQKKIYFNKNQVVMIEPELEQVIITNLENMPNLIGILKNSKKIRTDLYEATYEELKYKIHTQKNQIVKISYKDRLENKVDIELFNQTINTHFDDVLFEATIPKNYDIITQ